MIVNSSNNIELIEETRICSNTFERIDLVVQLV